MTVLQQRPSLFSDAPLFPLLLAGLCAVAACGGAPGDYSSDEQYLSGARLRVMEGNLSTGNAQSYEVYGMRIFQGLQPDIALVQECNYLTNSQADMDTFVHTTFGANFHYYRETSSAYQIPNCVVSRYPIVSSGSFTDPAVANRALTWAKIQLPNGKFVWAFSLHLLTSSAGNRDTEAKALVADIQANIPAADYLVIGGDFNTGTRTEACVNDLSAVVNTAGPFPVDGQGNGNTSEARSKPHDWVLAGHGLDELKTPVIIGGSTFPDGLVVDTRVYTPLSEIAPAQQQDSAANSMQHMGVVRDFLLRGAIFDGGTPTDGGSDGGTHTDGGTHSDGGTDGGHRQGIFQIDNPRPTQPSSHQNEPQLNQQEH